MNSDSLSVTRGYLLTAGRSAVVLSLPDPSATVVAWLLDHATGSKVATTSGITLDFGRFFAVCDRLLETVLVKRVDGFLREQEKPDLVGNIEAKLEPLPTGATLLVLRWRAAPAIVLDVRRYVGRLLADLEQRWPEVEQQCREMLAEALEVERAAVSALPGGMSTARQEPEVIAASPSELERRAAPKRCCLLADQYPTRASFETFQMKLTERLGHRPTQWEAAAELSTTREMVSRHCGHVAWEWPRARAHDE